MDDPLENVKDLEEDPSAIAADLDADGTADIVMGDENRDGEADWVLRRDADGTSIGMVDTDASGSLETGFVDSDADGRFDAVTRDVDDDAIIDVTQLDADGDGVFETMALADETVITLDPGTGLVTDVSQEVRPVEPDRQDPAPPPAPLANEPATQPIPPTTSSTTVDPGPPPVAPADAADPAPQTPWADDQPGIGDHAVTDAAPPAVAEPDPTAATDPAPPTPWAADQPGIGEDAPPYVEPVAEPQPVIDLVHGDGESEVQWGQLQTENGYCGPVSIAMVLSELTGIQYGEAQMVQAALQRNMLVGEPGDWDGMYVQDVAALLTEFGAASHVEYGTLDSLRAYLDQGRDIILFVDSSEVWHGTDDDGTAGDQQDHFLIITEIDDERGVATLNDPGWATGVGREVSLSVIEDAWQDSSYQMVVTDGGVVYGRADVGSTTSGAAAAGGGTEPAAAERPHSGFVILPVVLSALALLPRRGDDDSTPTPQVK